VFDQRVRDFEFRAGPIFANVVLVDEINRAMPKTQSALLEAMAEGQVTVDGVTRLLPDPFLLLATENPIEYEGTFPLPEAQLDRFLLKTALGYPDPDDEVRIVDEGTVLRGTAGALRLALDQGVLDEAFLVTYGDSFLPIDFAAAWEAFRASGAPAQPRSPRAPGRRGGRSGTSARHRSASALPEPVRRVRGRLKMAAPPRLANPSVLS